MTVDAEMLDSGKREVLEEYQFHGWSVAIVIDRQIQRYHEGVIEELEPGARVLLRHSIGATSVPWDSILLVRPPDHPPGLPGSTWSHPRLALMGSIRAAARDPQEEPLSFLDQVPENSWLGLRNGRRAMRIEGILLLDNKPAVEMARGQGEPLPPFNHYTIPVEWLRDVARGLE